MVALNQLRTGYDPVLRTPARPVADAALRPGTDEHAALVELVATMRQVMVASAGVGLAAPQIGRGLAVAVLAWKGTELAWANPRVVAASGAVSAEEGCLSLPGDGYWVTRAEQVTVEAFDVDAGAWATFSLSGWLARIAGHELDHLAGVLIDVAGTL